MSAKRIAAVFLVLMCLMLMGGCREETGMETEAPVYHEEDWPALLGACAYAVGETGKADLSDPDFAAVFLEELEKLGFSGEYGDFALSGTGPSTCPARTDTVFMFRTDEGAQTLPDGAKRQEGVLIALTPSGAREVGRYAVTARVEADLPLGLKLAEVSGI